jgi:hypothetical protein
MTADERLPVQATAAITAATLTTSLLAGAPAEPPAESGPSARSACAAGLSKISRLSDEFGRPRLGPKWRAYDFADDPDFYHSKELRYRPEQVRLDGRRLRLRIAKGAEPKGKYAAAAVESRFDVPGPDPGRPSCVEVRTRGFAAETLVTGADGSPVDQNVFSAVWLHHRPATKPLNPNPELDIQELVRARRMHSALHKWIKKSKDAPPRRTQDMHCYTNGDEEVLPYVSTSRCRDLTLPDLTRSAHVFGLRREIGVDEDGERVGILSFYVDQRLAWRLKMPPGNAYVRYRRHLILSTQGNPPGGPEGRFPKVATVDWVRTYR